MRTNRSYLLRDCYSKGVSQHHLPLVGKGMGTLHSEIKGQCQVYLDRSWYSMWLVCTVNLSFSGSAAIIIPTLGDFLGHRVSDKVQRSLSEVCIQYNRQSKSISRENTN